MKKFYIYLIFILCVTYKANSFNKLKNYEPRTFEIGAGTTYLDTSANFNGDGNKVDLFGSNKYTLFTSFVTSRYVFPGLWSVSATANVSNAESKNSDFVRTNSTFSQLSLTADYMVYRGFMDFIPELTFSYSLDPIEKNQDTVMTNEGVMELIAMLKAQNSYSWFSYYLGCGFNYRNERSGLFPWNVGGGVRWGQSFVGIEVSGFQSVMDDPDKGTLESPRYSLIQKVNGGSYRFYSVNPSETKASLNIDLGFSRGIVLKSFVATSLVGQNFSSGLYAGLGITLLFDAFSKKQPDFHESIQEEKYKIQTEDGVDQNLFQKEPEIPKAPVRSDQKPKEVLSDNDLQSQLDEAEMTIKLKSNKKKKRKR